MINSDSLWCSCSKIYFIDGVPVFNIHIMENKLLPDNTRRFADVKFSPSFLFLEQNYGFDEDEKQVLIHHIWDNRHLLQLMAYEEGVCFDAPPISHTL